MSKQIVEFMAKVSNMKDFPAELKSDFDRITNKYTKKINREVENAEKKKLQAEIKALREKIKQIDLAKKEVAKSE